MMRALDGAGAGQSALLAALGAAASLYIAADWVPPGFHPLLMAGFARTAGVTLGAILLGLAVTALLVGALASTRAALRSLGWAVISAGRSVPLVCTLLLAYWVPPLVGLDLPPLWCAVLAIGAVEACYLAVVLDGLRRQIAGRYADAAYMLGLRPWVWRRRILWPQVSRLAMPHLMNFAVYAVKGSALSSFIAVQDLTQTARLLSSATADPVPAYAILFAAYVVVAAILTFAGQALEARLARSMPVEAAGFRDA